MTEPHAAAIILLSDHTLSSYTLVVTSSSSLVFLAFVPSLSSVCLIILHSSDYFDVPSLLPFGCPNHSTPVLHVLVATYPPIRFSTCRPLS